MYMAARCGRVDDTAECITVQASPSTPLCYVGKWDALAGDKALRVAAEAQDGKDAAAEAENDCVYPSYPCMELSLR
jgi:hypothetical protein